MGTSFIDKIFASGLMDALTKAASILGMVMVGAMVSSQVNVKLAWTINISGAEVVVLDVLNSIMPGILSVGLVFGLMALIKKGWTPTKLVLLILFGAVGLAFFGIF
jgi:mannose/fructose/N-acetylgalactosamine-specific phosphotransferase system component IID